MGKRPDAGAVTEYRKLALSHHFHDLATGANRRPWSIEVAVTKYDSFKIASGHDSRLDLTNCRKCLFHQFRRIGIQRLIFGFYGPTFAYVRKAGITLCHETADT